MQYLYEIVNNINGKRYVGRTNNIEKRWKRHITELNNHNHHSIYLQRAWDKYGEENFTFNIIDTRETLEEIEILEEETINMDYENMYNVSRQSYGGDLISYHPNLDEIKKKHSKNGKQWYSNFTEEEKLAYAEKYTGKKNPNYRHGNCTKEAIEKRHQEWLNKTHEERYVHTIGKDPWNKGMKFPYKPWSEKRRKIMEESNKDKKGIPVCCEGVWFKNLSHPADLYGITKQAILVRINSKNEKFKDFFYFDENNHNINDFIIYDRHNKEYFENRIKIKKTPQHKLISCEGIIMTIQEASEKYGIGITGICARCKSQSDKWKKFYYLEELEKEDQVKRLSKPNNKCNSKKRISIFQKDDEGSRVQPSGKGSK